MRTIFKAILLVTVLFFATLARPSSAQEVTRAPEATRHAVSLDGGVESAFVARAAYSYRLGLRALPDARVFARLTWPVVAPDFGDWAIDVGARATAARRGDLRLAFVAGPVLRRNENELFSAVAMGLAATMLAGFEAARWGLSLEAGYEQLFSTYVRPSELYRDVFYGGAKSGWYALSGSTARVGLRGGGRAGPVEIFARAGLDATGAFRAISPPFYATLGGCFAF